MIDFVEIQADDFFNFLHIARSHAIGEVRGDGVGLAELWLLLAFLTMNMHGFIAFVRVKEEPPAEEEDDRWHDT